MRQLVAALDVCATASVLDLLLANTAAEETVDALARLGYEHDVRRLVRHRPAQFMLGAEAILGAFRTADPLEFLSRELPSPLLQMTASHLDAGAEARLAAVLQEEDPSRHAMAASLLFAADPSWMPPGEDAVHLTGGRFPNARWAGICLPGAHCFGANLASADLSHGDLRGANLGRARLSHSRLRGAKLANAQFQMADLSGADFASCSAERAVFVGANLAGACFERAVLREANLHRANLSAACLAKANLTGAMLARADLAGADLAGAQCKYASFHAAKLPNANLRGATFFETDFSTCSLESMDLSNAVFYAASLESALMTASQAPGVCFLGANLRGAGLADIDWPGADLRYADLRGSTFHLGSSRSGLVGSYLAGEGSRTGFYTDEFHEQEFKSPEEIRKANLCRADLREAQIEGVDFYLVDLRGARYTPQQADHFRQCGAILEHRAREG